MSGRDKILQGFGEDSISLFYDSVAHPGMQTPISKSLLNYFLNIASGFRIDRIEFWNAVDLYARSVQNSANKIACSAVFFACLRLSVFWRRRKDILSQNKDILISCLGAVRASIQSVQEAESEVLSSVGCHIWDGISNVVEAIYITLIRAGVREVNVVKDITVDICHLMSVSLFMDYTAWYVQLLMNLFYRLTCIGSVGQRVLLWESLSSLKHQYMK